MSATPYLAEEAAALGDRELSPRLRPVSDTIILELEYAIGLFRRAEKAINDELNVLAAAGINLDVKAASSVPYDLMRLAVLAHIAVVHSKEARANGL